MKHTRRILIAFVLLTACTSAPTASPVAAPTTISTPLAALTATPEPPNTAVPAITPTPKPFTTMTVSAVLTASTTVPTNLPLPTSTGTATTSFTRTRSANPTLATQATQPPTSTQIPTPTQTAGPTATHKPTDTPAPPTLRQLADSAGVKIGSAVSYELFDGPLNSKLMDIFKRDFNLAVIHNAMYWNEGCEPEEGQESRNCIDFVRRQIEALNRVGIHDIRGHPLVFPGRSPKWLQDDVRRGVLSKEQLIKILQSHISTTVRRWKASINEWIVVNEPYRHWAEDDDIFQTLIGDEYIDIAFQAAREADPQATLIFNDTFNHARASGYSSTFQISNTVNTEQTRVIVNRLKSKGLIDGVGLQMHLDGAYPPNKQDVIETMKSYGVPVYVTEVDIDMRNVSGTQERRLAKQAELYADALDACLQSGVCRSFSLWEFGDKYSWTENPQFHGTANADATPYDDNLEPKPAYYALRDVLVRYIQERTRTATPGAP